MSTIDDAKWEKLREYHNNCIPGAAVTYGLSWYPDPGHFTHRALVFLADDEWHLHAWGNIHFPFKGAPVKGEWINCGAYKSKLTAMRQARNMARLFESLRPKEAGDE